MTTSPQMACPKCWSGSKKAACAHCKGAGTVDDVRLSPSFMLSEFIKSNTAKAKGIANVPDAKIVENLKGLALAMEPVKGVFGDKLTINSGYRCPPWTSSWPVWTRRRSCDG